jgi:tRNA nucleotidyltransferase (CCA-adding enzyme)
MEPGSSPGASQAAGSIEWEAGRLGQDVPATDLLSCARQLAETLNTLTPEQARGAMGRVVGDQLCRLLIESERPSVELAWLNQQGLIAKHFPEVAALQSTPQDPRWHPEGNVWNHTLMVLDCAADAIRSGEYQLSIDERLIVMLGALCHDLGKPAASALSEGGITANRHEAFGQAPAASLLGRLGLEEATVRGVLQCVRHHMQPPLLAREVENGRLSERQYQNAVRRFAHSLAPLSGQVVMAVCEADYRGRSRPGRDDGPYEAGVRFREALIQSERQAVPDIISGRDLIALGMKPGPGLGRVLKEINARHAAGEIDSRAEALTIVQREFGDCLRAH